MNKTEFTETLRRSISGVGDYQFVNDTIRYYEDYIDSQISKGATEESVMEELGDPRLIAKSILATRQDIPEEAGGYTDAEDNAGSNRTTVVIGGRALDLPNWVIKTVGVLVVILILVLLFIIGKALFPFIAIALIAGLVWKFIRDNFI